MEEKPDTGDKKRLQVTVHFKQHTQGETSEKKEKEKLFEASPTGKFCCPGCGLYEKKLYDQNQQNHLGKLIMEIREDIKH